MPIEHALPAYESIDNYILQILLYTLASVIVALLVAVRYLFRYFKADLEKAIEREVEMTEALNNTSTVLSELSADISEIKKKLGA